MLEKDIQKGIIAYLKTIKTGYVLRISTTGIYDPKTKRMRTNQNQKGCSDILFFFRGKCTAIEVKTISEYRFVMKHYDRLRDIGKCRTKRDRHLHEQIMFIEGLKKSGNSGFFACSIEGVKEELGLTCARNLNTH